MLRIPSDVKDQIQLTDQQYAWLDALLDDWHILADLSFSDLIMWVPSRDHTQFFAVAQIRPSTGPTSLEDDVVGDKLAATDDNVVTQAFLSGEIRQTSTNRHRAGAPVDLWAVPLVTAGTSWAVIERHSNQMGLRAPGELEDRYLSVADTLFDMVWRGQFPDPKHSNLRGISPRVGEGLILLDEAGIVVYVTPNAVGAYRKLGLTTDLTGEALAPLTIALSSSPGDPVDMSLASLFRSATPEEWEVAAGSASIFLRILPLFSSTGRVGTLVIIRDTTELRQRERQLVTKDATIREIHHRVKNNLQTVSALLRLQARRMESQEAAAALKEAMARVQAISVVHEILSYSMSDLVDFDDVMDRLLKLVGDLGAERGHVNATRVGSFGEISATTATSLSLVVTELCQNAIKHGMSSGSGNLEVRPVRGPDGSLEVSVIDDGQGLPPGFQVHDHARSSLGLSIVTTLLEDLHGTFRLEPNPNGIGARAVVSIPA